MKLCDCSKIPCGAFCDGVDSCDSTKHKVEATKGDVCVTCYYAELEDNEPISKTRKTKFSHEED